MYQPCVGSDFSTSKVYQGINVLTTTPQPWASPAPENKNRPLCKRRWNVFSTPKCNLEWSSPCSGRPLLS